MTIIPALIRIFPMTVIILVYFSSSRDIAGIALILGIVVTKLSFGSDFERLERKLDLFFFGSAADPSAVKQYELLHETAFQVKRPETFDEATAQVQRKRSTAFSLVDVFSPLVMLILTGHFIWRLIAN